MLSRISTVLFSGVLSVGVMTGCASPLPERPVGGAGLLPAERVFRKNYEIGLRQETVVGQSIATVKDFMVRRVHGPMMTPTVACHVKSGTDSFRIEPGVAYPVKGVVTIDGGDFNDVELMVERGIVTVSHNALVDERGVPYPRFAVRTGDKTFLMKSAAKLDPPDVRFEYTQDDKVVDQKSGFTNFELIYAGNDGRSFSLSYREYTPDDLAKPAFSQSLVYPLGSTSIRFRSLLLTIHDVTSEKITYTVVADNLG